MGRSFVQREPLGGLSYPVLPIFGVVLRESLLTVSKLSADVALHTADASVRLDIAARVHNTHR